jgi:hypothetical protein
LGIPRATATDGIIGLEACTVEEEEVILEDFFFACNTLTIRGYIDGDAVGIASRVIITRTGWVTGDVWVFGGQLSIEGIVGEDIHFGGVDLDILGLARLPNPRTDVFAAALSMEMSPETLIPGDVIFYGYQALLLGSINGNVDFQGQALVLGKRVAGEVAATVGDQEANAPLNSLPLLYTVDFHDPGLYLEESAFILGALRYEAPTPLSVGKAVGGEVFYTQSVPTASLAQAQRSETFIQILGNYLFITIRDVIALSVIGITMLNFFTRFFSESSYRVQTRPIPSFSLGLMLALVFTPIALLGILTSLILLMVISIITLSEITVLLAILLTVLNLGFMGGFFFALAFLGRALSCFVLGFVLVRGLRNIWQKRIGTPPVVLNELWFPVVLGTSLVSLVVHMPLGAVVAVLQLVLTGIFACVGLGGVFMYLRDVWYARERPPRLVGRKSIPPPPDDTDDQHLRLPFGMENLPSGFRGFED